MLRDLIRSSSFAFVLLVSACGGSQDSASPDAIGDSSQAVSAAPRLSQADVQAALNAKDFLNAQVASRSYGVLLPFDLKPTLKPSATKNLDGTSMYFFVDSKSGDSLAYASTAVVPNVRVVVDPLTNEYWVTDGTEKRNPSDRRELPTPRFYAPQPLPANAQFTGTSYPPNLLFAIQSVLEGALDNAGNVPQAINVGTFGNRVGRWGPNEIGFEGIYVVSRDEVLQGMVRRVGTATVDKTRHILSAQLQEKFGSSGNGGFGSGVLVQDTVSPEVYQVNLLDADGTLLWPKP